MVTYLLRYIGIGIETAIAMMPTKALQIRISNLIPSSRNFKPTSSQAHCIKTRWTRRAATQRQLEGAIVRRGNLLRWVWRTYETASRCKTSRQNPDQKWWGYLSFRRYGESLLQCSFFPLYRFHRFCLWNRSGRCCLFPNLKMRPLCPFYPSSCCLDSTWCGDSVRRRVV